MLGQKKEYQKQLQQFQQHKKLGQLVFQWKQDLPKHIKQNLKHLQFRIPLQDYCDDQRCNQADKTEFILIIQNIKRWLYKQLILPSLIWEQSSTIRFLPKLNILAKIDFRNLKSLCLYRCLIENIQPLGYFQLAQLNQLDLSYNNICSIKSLQKLIQPQLKYLSLQFNHFDHHHLKYLARMKLNLSKLIAYPIIQKNTEQYIKKNFCITESIDLYYSYYEQYFIPMQRQIQIKAKRINFYEQIFKFQIDRSNCQVNFFLPIRKNIQRINRKMGNKLMHLQQIDYNKQSNLKRQQLGYSVLGLNRLFQNRYIASQYIESQYITQQEYNIIDQTP